MTADTDPCGEPEPTLLDEGPRGSLRPIGALIGDWIAQHAPPGVT